MSLFEVAAREIDTVAVHPNADRLELATVKGLTFQFVVPKGSLKSGDHVVYFPIDSILPDALATKMGVKNYLAGKLKDRVKTAKLRGCISQGIVTTPDIAGLTSPEINKDYKDVLGVTKYDPPVVPCHAGNLLPLPSGVSSYDIEGADNFPDVVDLLMDQIVYISEKLEGTNWSATKTADKNVFVSQHNYTIQELPDKKHDFWEVARKQGLLAYLDTLAARYPGKDVTIRGELLGPGIQKNIYKLKDFEVRLFDIEVNSQSLSSDQFLFIAMSDNVKVVPKISVDKTLREWLGGKSLQEISNGKSLLADTPREGIVIKPLTEQRHSKIGRLMIKQRSPEYLAGSDF
jgi:RNA ligase (TIGR02306 family)